MAGERGEDTETVTLIGRDPLILEAVKYAGLYAACDTAVLIRGETGTGKELIARVIHSLSRRAKKPFVAVNCTSLASTLFESELFGHLKGSFTDARTDRQGRFGIAADGTILLDEIADIPDDLQSKLLRVLQERKFYAVGSDTPQLLRARVLAATHRDLEAMVDVGEFRRDLYHRLRVGEIQLPPLRSRLGDVPALVEHFVAKSAVSQHRPVPLIASDAQELLLEYAWPGNVRELENRLADAVAIATGGVIRRRHLRLGDRKSASAFVHRSLAQITSEHVGQVLHYTAWNKSKAARILGVSRTRLDRLIERHHLAQRAPLIVA